jgi:hypothetical protein
MQSLFQNNQNASERTALPAAGSRRIFLELSDETIRGFCIVAAILLAAFLAGALAGWMS